MTWVGAQQSSFVKNESVRRLPPARGLAWSIFGSLMLVASDVWATTRSSRADFGSFPFPGKAGGSDAARRPARAPSMSDACA